MIAFLRQEVETRDAEIARLNHQIRKQTVLHEREREMWQLEFDGEKEGWDYENKVLQSKVDILTKQVNEINHLSEENTTLRNQVRDIAGGHTETELELKRELALQKSYLERVKVLLVQTYRRSMNEYEAQVKESLFSALSTQTQELSQQNTELQNNLDQARAEIVTLISKLDDKRDEIRQLRMQNSIERGLGLEEGRREVKRTQGSPATERSIESSRPKDTSRLQPTPDVPKSSNVQPRPYSSNGLSNTVSTKDPYVVRLETENAKLKKQIKELSSKPLLPKSSPSSPKPPLSEEQLQGAQKRHLAHLQRNEERKRLQEEKVIAEQIRARTMVSLKDTKSDADVALLIRKEVKQLRDTKQLATTGPITPSTTERGEEEKEEAINVVSSMHAYSPVITSTRDASLTARSRPTSASTFGTVGTSLSPTSLPVLHSFGNTSYSALAHDGIWKASAVSSPPSQIGTPISSLRTSGRADEELARVAASPVSPSLPTPHADNPQHTPPFVSSSHERPFSSASTRERADADRSSRSTPSTTPRPATSATPTRPTIHSAYAQIRPMHTHLALSSQPSLRTPKGARPGSLSVTAQPASFSDTSVVTEAAETRKRRQWRRVEQSLPVGRTDFAVKGHEHVQMQPFSIQVNKNLTTFLTP
ncbi:hypothetical protein BLNAU_17603 [Blattamonas nauphoetae]|uniref:Uncharacterized protein n=1 Tax=Blattamonas nauphoetae TaxID=2049346 RepID=A0ABQ9X6N6_9EUKA|nr:hypothetical protein BLNAU_17603 [Blattamonas nauphoetae]